MLFYDYICGCVQKLKAPSLISGHIYEKGLPKSPQTEQVFSIAWGLLGQSFHIKKFPNFILFHYTYIVNTTCSPKWFSTKIEVSKKGAHENIIN